MGRKRSITYTILSNLKALLYVSEAVKHFSESDLSDLEALSSSYNKRKGIFGYLYYDGQKFLQYLEGDEAAVTVLFEKITNDKRHRILGSTVEEIYDKRFPNWSMKLLQDSLFEPNLVENTIIETFTLFSKHRHTIGYEQNRELFRLIDFLKDSV